MMSKDNIASGFRGAVCHYMASLISARNFAGAVKCYEDHLRELDTADRATAGETLRLAATAYASLANYPTALRVARMAQSKIESLGDTPELAEVFMTIGAVLRDMGELREAEKVYRDAESVFRRNDCTDGQSRALNMWAGLLFRQNDYKNALTVLMDSIELAKRNNDRKKLAYMMGNIGRIYTFIGDFEQAKKHLQINIDISTELKQVVELSRAYLSLGYIQIQEADYITAEETLDKAYKNICQCKSKRDEVIYHTYLGELKYRSGHLREAHQILEKGLSLAECISPDTTLVGRMLRHLAECCVLQQDYNSARRFIARSLTMMEVIGEKVELGALWKLRAIIDEVDGELSKSREHFVKAIDLLDQSRVRFEKVYALVAAGASKSFDQRQRLTYLFRAGEFYRGNNIPRRLDGIERLLDRIAPSAINEPTNTDRKNGRKLKREYLTQNEEIKRFLSQLPLIATSDLPLLLTGETGVGKDHLASCFHDLARPDKPFVAVNCASIPETLLESELFGYHRGAFTGADHDKRGLFVAANGGVLFLDEIGDMSLFLQAKLLGVLESRQVTPVGSTKPIELDIKLVVATNRNLEEMVEAGTFRRDLYYRISGISFRIPALRERKEDIPVLVQHFLAKCGLIADGDSVPSELVHQFVSYDWPGNTRELQNQVKRLELMSQLVKEGDLVEIGRSIFSSVAPTTRKESLFERVEQFERKIITEALLAADGNKSEAARILGIHEATVRSKLKRFAIFGGQDRVN